MYYLILVDDGTQQGYLENERTWFTLIHPIESSRFSEFFPEKPLLGCIFHFESDEEARDELSERQACTTRYKLSLKRAEIVVTEVD